MPVKRQARHPQIAPLPVWPRRKPPIRNWRFISAGLGLLDAASCPGYRRGMVCQLREVVGLGVQVVKQSQLVMRTEKRRLQTRNLPPEIPVVATTGGAVSSGSSGSGGIRWMTISPCGRCNYRHHNNLRSIAGKNSKSATLSIELRAQVMLQKTLTVLWPQAHFPAQQPRRLLLWRTPVVKECAIPVKGPHCRSFPTPCQVGGLAKARTSWPGSEGGGGGRGPLGEENSSR